MTEEEKTAILTAMDNMKKEHAIAVLNKMAELTDLVNSRSDIWSYGLPPSLVNVINILTMQRRNIENDFNFPSTSAPIVI